MIAVVILVTMPDVSYQELLSMQKARVANLGQASE